MFTYRRLGWWRTNSRGSTRSRYRSSRKLPWTERKQQQHKAINERESCKYRRRAGHVTGVRMGTTPRKLCSLVSIIQRIESWHPCSATGKLYFYYVILPPPRFPRPNFLNLALVSTKWFLLLRLIKWKGKIGNVFQLCNSSRASLFQFAQIPGTRQIVVLLLMHFYLGQRGATRRRAVH